MTGVIAVPDGGFAYLPGGITPFSNGVVALPGYVLARVRLRSTPPLAEGLAFAASFLSDEGRPRASLAACELRSPSPLTMADFTAFNARYSDVLGAHGFGAEDRFPVARSNMAPRFEPPAAHALFAFSYALRSGGDTSGKDGPDFVISGQPEITTTDPPAAVAAGDVSPAGMSRKAQHVIAELQRRVEALGGRWSDITGAQAYTIRSLDPVMELLGWSGLVGQGLSLFPGSPPVVGFDFEIDVRAVSVERVAR